MAIITYYRINKKITSELNNTILFNNPNARDIYFQELPKKQITVNLSPSWKKNIHKLYNSITLYDEGREPFNLYNYIKIEQGGFDYFFYILNHEELGSNQINYKLKLDVMMTYLSTNDVINLEDEKVIVMREHKDRFNFSSNKPIYDKTIEDVDLIPSVVQEMDLIKPDRIRLGLKQLGGNLDNNGRLLSHPLIVWEIFYNNPNNRNMKDGSLKTFKTVRFLPGWAFRGEATVKIKEFIVTFKTVAPTSLIKLSIEENSGRYVFEAFSENGDILSINNLLTSDIGGILSPSGDGKKLYLSEGMDELQIKISNSSYAGLYYNAGVKEGTFAGMRFLREFFVYGVAANFRDSNDLNSLNGSFSKVVELPYNILGMLGNSMPLDYPVFANASSMYITPLNLTDLTPRDGINNFTDNFKVSIYQNTFDYNKSLKRAKIPGNEPKLYTSQFSPLFLKWYDEAVLIKRENTEIDDLNLSIKVDKSSLSKATLNIGDYDDFELNEIGGLKRQISLNNEVTRFTSNLEEYVKNSYDIERQMMEIQQAKATRNIWQSGLNSAIGGASQIAKGYIGMSIMNPASLQIAPAMMGVGAATTTISTITNIAFAMADLNDMKKEQELQMKTKFINLQASLINISGQGVDANHINDDDAIKLFRIGLQQTEFEYLDSYFHRFGYKTLEYKNPVLRTRKYFDYKQLIIEDFSTYFAISKESEEEIKRRFAEGVTIYHYNGDLDEKVDFAQIYENWEV